MNSYFYSREQLEKLADEINRQFFPERLSKLSPLDCYALLEKLGLDVEWKYISPGNDMLGMLFFDSSYWYVWPTGFLQPGQKPTKEFFRQGTVVINQVLLDNKDEKRERFVVGHEISHWLKDWSYFANHPEGIFDACSKNDVSKTNWSSAMSEMEIIERQTNSLNAALLLPRDTLKNRFFELNRYKSIPSEPIEYKTFMNKAIATISKDTGLHFNPVLYRLYDLRILRRDDTKGTGNA